MPCLSMALTDLVPTYCPPIALSLARTYCIALRDEPQKHMHNYGRMYDSAGLLARKGVKGRSLRPYLSLMYTSQHTIVHRKAP
jgi:hypothetical protein